MTESGELHRLCSVLAAMRIMRTIMSKMNSVVHFEMPYDDRERMAKFYQDAFGWRTQMLGEEIGNYVLARTTETDESGPKKPGAINGGFFPKKPDWPAQHPSVVIAVDGIRTAMSLLLPRPSLCRR
jgi:predicted enzyme related to lactoylglutathione lyase